MKKVSILLISFLTAISVRAQTGTSVQAEQKTSSLSVIVNGSKNLQMTIDEKNSSLLNSKSLVEKTAVSMENLAIGSHTLLIVRTNQNNDRTERIATTFNLRYNYDMLIKVNRNGSLELIETKHTGTPGSVVAMSDRDFNTLLTSVRNQRSTAKRSSAITDAFNNTKYFFTTSQVKQLLLLVNSESSRIQLAKLSYLNITDRSNFYSLYELFKSETGQNELEDFVSDYNDDRNSNTAMTDASFNILYQDIKNQYYASTQMTSLTNAFNNTNNYFSSYQASQLIQLVSTENNRLPLAKLSYRSITNPDYFNQVTNLISSQAGKKELTVYINNYNQGNGSNTAMSDANFNTLFQEIKNQYYASTQMTSLTNAFNNTNNYFSSYQASQLIQLVGAENNRLELAKLSYRSITDRNYFNQVVNLISSQSGKNELTVYVKNYNQGNGSNMAMTDVNFNTLYHEIKNQYYASTQMTSLTNAFNNTNNYFNSYQASLLIQLVSAENNRLQLAKLSYRSITDPNYFIQVANLISSQAGKNELTVYVNNYNQSNDSNIAMSDTNFNTLYQDIKNQWNVNIQMTLLTNAFNNTNNNFSSYQASQLIQLVSAENNRLQLAKLSYRSITDPNYFSQVVNLISSQAGKNELTVYANNYNQGNSSNLAMSVSNFNTLYQDIKNQWNVNTQMTSLSNAFNNTNNYFNSYQASQLIQLVSLESNRLQLAKLSYRSITDSDNFIQVANLISSQASKNELTAYVNNNYNTGSSPNTAMSDANFNTLYQDIKNQWNVNTQMTSLTSAFNNTNNYFSSYQASQLIQLVSVESNRLQLAKLSYRSITDQSNFSQVVNVLTSQTTKNELTAYVNNNYDTGSSPNVAMSDANFKALIQGIERQFLPFEQMYSLTDAFKNTSNYFTTAQAKQLIPLVSYESNRLELAKLSYRTITDRSNFNQLNALLSDQSSRNELDAYVKAYKD